MTGCLVVLKVIFQVVRMRFFIEGAVFLSTNVHERDSVEWSMFVGVLVTENYLTMQK